MSTIKLKEAMLCTNCESIFDFPENTCNGVCPSCASNSYLNLGVILNRTTEDEKDIPK